MLLMFGVGAAASHGSTGDSLPFRNAFALLFYVSEGMLFDPQVLVDRPLQVLSVTLVIMLGKSIGVAVFGDAAEAATLVQAHVADAAVLVLPGVDSTTTRPLLETARRLNPELRIVALAETTQEADWLRASGVGVVVEPAQAVASVLRDTIVEQRAAAPRRRGR